MKVSLNWELTELEIVNHWNLQIDDLEEEEVKHENKNFEGPFSLANGSRDSE